MATGQRMKMGTFCIFISWVLVILVLVTLPISTHAGFGKPAQKVRLADVQTLTFTKDESTSSRRSSSIPQMKCTGSNCQYAPNSAMCRNIGLDGHDVVWQCEAGLPRGVKLGKVVVSCEGYDFPEDEYVLYGSCGLKYTLDGKPVYPEDVLEQPSFLSRTFASMSDSIWPLYLFHTKSASSLWSIIGFFLPTFLFPSKTTTNQFLSSLSSTIHTAIQALVLLFLAWIVYRLFLRRSPPRASRRPSRSWSNFWPLSFLNIGNPISTITNAMWSVPRDNVPPPPPYAKHDPRTNSTTQTQSSSMNAPSDNSGGATFTQGLLGGGLLGLLLGRRWGSRTAEANERSRQRVADTSASYESEILRHRSSRHQSPPRTFESQRRRSPPPSRQPVSVGYARTERR